MVYFVYLLATPFCALVCLCTLIQAVIDRNWPLLALGGAATAALVAGVVFALRGMKDAGDRRW